MRREFDIPARVIQGFNPNTPQIFFCVPFQPWLDLKEIFLQPLYTEGMKM